MRIMPFLFLKHNKLRAWILNCSCQTLFSFCSSSTFASKSTSTFSTSTSTSTSTSSSSSSSLSSSSSPSFSPFPSISLNPSSSHSTSLSSDETPLSQYKLGGVRAKQYTENPRIDHKSCYDKSFNKAFQRILHSNLRCKTYFENCLDSIYRLTRIVSSFFSEYHFHLRYGNPAKVRQIEHCLDDHGSSALDKMKAMAHNIDQLLNSLKPCQPFAWLELGKLYADLGDIDAAKRMYRLALRHSMMRVRDREALAYVSYCCTRAGDHERAIRFFRWYNRRAEMYPWDRLKDKKAAAAAKLDIAIVEVEMFDTVILSLLAKDKLNEAIFLCDTPRPFSLRPSYFRYRESFHFFMLYFDQKRSSIRNSNSNSQSRKQKKELEIRNSVLDVLGRYTIMLTKYEKRSQSFPRVRTFDWLPSETCWLIMNLCAVVDRDYYTLEKHVPSHVAVLIGFEVYFALFRNHREGARIFEGFFDLVYLADKDTAPALVLAGLNYATAVQFGFTRNIRRKALEVMILFDLKVAYDLFIYFIILAGDHDEEEISELYSKMILGYLRNRHITEAANLYIKYKKKIGKPTIWTEIVETALYSLVGDKKQLTECISHFYTLEFLSFADLDVVASIIIHGINTHRKLLSSSVQKSNNALEMSARNLLKYVLRQAQVMYKAQESVQGQDLLSLKELLIMYRDARDMESIKLLVLEMDKNCRGSRFPFSHNQKQIVAESCVVCGDVDYLKKFSKR